MTLTSTQCSTSVGGFWFPAHSRVRQAKKGLSVVPVKVKGGAVIDRGLNSVDGGGSVKHETVTLIRKVVICKL